MNKDFLERTSNSWGLTIKQAESLLNTQYYKSFRINPLKVRKSTLKNIKRHYKFVEPLPWLDNAYIVKDDSVKLSELPEFLSGEIIIQNPASYIPVLELRSLQGDNILDLCAAPGGKSSHIAAFSDNKACLILNDTSRTRFFNMKKLMQNMGVAADYSLRDGRYVSKDMGKDVFDKILLDAPCSGEANLHPDNLGNWSLNTIKRLSGLQSKLLQEAFIMLKPGGRLVYSTCTMAPEENETVIDSLLRHNFNADIITPNNYPVDKIPGITQWNGKNLDIRISNTIRLLPSKTCKPFYIAIITKTTAQEDDSYERLKQRYL